MLTTCPEHSANRPAPRGFTIVSMLFILVVLAVLGVALAKMATRQQMGSAADLEQARAQQSARAGLEWAAWQLLRNPAPPAAAPACFGTTSFSPGGSLADFTVTLSCSRTPGSGTLSDGDASLVFYQVVANACNLSNASACPSSASAPPAHYVERQLSWTLVR
jgi:MSHA biogenesis protein MshP